MQRDNLIGLDARGFVDGLGIKTLKIEIAFGPGDKKSEGPMDRIKTSKIQIPSIQDVNGSGFEWQFVEDIDIVNFAMGNDDESGDVAA